MNKQKLLIAASLVTLSSTTIAAEDSWFVRPYAGFSQMFDQSSAFADIDGLSGDADIELDSGFTGGIGVGYRYTENFAAEFGWEYRSNDSEVTLADTSEFDDGNYASNILYLNGHYLFDRNGKWQPYAGAGLTWVEEVDIDLERGGNELSYSSESGTGYQLFAGVNYDLNADWTLQSEIRYGSITDIDLDGEANDVGEFDSIDYETTTIQLGLVFDF